MLWKLKIERTPRGGKKLTQNLVKVRRQKTFQLSDVMLTNGLAKESCGCSSKGKLSLTGKVHTTCARQEYFQMRYNSFPGLSLHGNLSCVVG